MGRPFKYDYVQALAMIEDPVRTLSTRSIARICGIPAITLYKFLERRGVPTRGPQFRNRKRDSEIVRLVGVEKLSLADVAARIGTTKGAVSGVWEQFKKRSIDVQDLTYLHATATAAVFAFLAAVAWVPVLAP